MALTQEQVDAWFDANPNATAEEVAAAVQSVGGLAANEGLASMIANRYAIAEPEVTNYYNTWAGVPVEDKTAKIDTKVDLPAFTDTIFTGAPTTQEELLSVLADSTVTGGTGNDTIVGATGVDTVVGGTGNDTVVSGTGEDTVAGSTTQTQAVANPFAAITAAWTNGDYAATNAIIASSNLTADDIQSYYGLDDYTMDWVLRQGIKTADQVSTVTGATGNDTVVGATGNDTVTGVTAADTVVGATGNDTVVGATGNDATYTAGNWPTIISGTTGTDGDVLTTTTTSDGTPFYLRDEDGGGMYQNPNTVESYAPFTGSDGKTYYAIYAPVFSSGKAWNETPITGYMTEAQFRAFQGGSTFGDALSNMANSPVGQFALGVLGPYGQAFNAANQASQGNYLAAFLSGTNAAQGFGVTNLGGFDIKTVQNVARGLNAIDKNDLMGALTAGSNLLGGIPGDYTTVTNLASATLALKNNDTAGFLTAMGDLTGSADAKTAAAATRLLAAVSADSPNLAAIQAAANGLSSAVNKTSTTGTDTSAAITTLSAEDLAELQPGELNAYQSGGVQGLADFRRDMRLLNSLTGSSYTGDSLGGDYTNASTITGATGNDVTLPTGTQLASTGTGFEVGTISGAPIFAESANASSITAPFGYRLTSSSETDAKPTGSFYDPTTNAWFSPDTAVTDLTGNATIKTDADLFNSSLGTLDELDTTRSANEFADFLATLGITNTTQLTDSGLSNQDILDMINALDDTVTVTGATGNDTITGANANDGLETVTVTGAKGNDTLTGGTGNDKTTTLQCEAGFEPNADNTQCIPVVTVVDKLCGPGKVYDEDLKFCVDIQPEGCAPGFHDDGTGFCIPNDDKTTLTCEEGFEPNEAGTACIPVVEIKDKKCDPGFVYDEDLKQCVAIADEPCDEGYHRENGVCVQNECPDGYIRDLATGQCVLPPTPLDCPEGYEPNEAGTACIPVVEIKDKKCDPGYVYDEEQQKCVRIEEEPCDEGYHRENGVCVLNECPEGYVRDLATGQCVLPEEECATGFHRDEATGLCVPDDDDKCDPGFERINGACVPVCSDGYIRNLTTGVCEKPLECAEGFELNDAGTECIPVIKVTACPTGQHRDETGKCVPDTEECAEGFHLEDGLCVPDDDDKCETGYEKVNGTCVPVCKEGYIRNLATGVCETEDKGCPPGQVKDASGKCVPIVKPPPPPPIVCPTGFKLVNGACVPIPKTTAMPTMGASGAGEKTDPIYAGGMDSFNLLATLQELLAEEAPKKDDKKSKDKTKMASGGHLDDLLAEQMTVDDLLKLLR